MFQLATRFLQNGLGERLSVFAVSVCTLGLPGIAFAQSADGPQAVPDFSGYFALQTPAYAAPARGGLGPLTDHPDHLRPERTNLPPNAWVGDFNNPMLTPRTAAEIKRRAELELAGEATYTAFQNCEPLGVPLVISHRENLQILQEPDKVTIIYQRDQWTRHIDLNVGHTNTLDPSWYGESMGHYEGDTLVIDTIGMNGRSRVDRYGSFGSEHLHVVERYHLAENGQVLQVDFTVEDPNSFEASWNATQYYPQSELGWAEVICAENNRDAKTGFEYEGMAVATKVDF